MASAVCVAGFAVGLLAARVIAAEPDATAPADKAAAAADKAPDAPDAKDADKKAPDGKAPNDQRAGLAPLKLSPGTPLELICQTRAVSVADEAKATTGRIRLRLEATPGDAATSSTPPAATSATPSGSAASGGNPDKAPSPAAASASPTASSPLTGRWTVLDVPAAHAASFALMHRETCAAAPCPLDIGAPPAVNLWAPSKTMPDKLAAGVSMTLVAVDLDRRTLRASSFRDNAIAALEQGDCE